MMKKYKTYVFRAVSVALMLAIAICAASVNPVSAKTKESKAHNIVILYFSATGVTKATAQKVRKATKGKLIEIKAFEPYTEEDLDYGNDESRVVKEHETADSPAASSLRPEISNMDIIKKAVKKADVVYIGYPVWWGEAPHIVYSLVENINLKKKTVMPFCTSVSSGLGNSAKHLKANANISNKTTWLKGRNFYDVPSQKTVNKWLKGLKY